MHWLAFGILLLGAFLLLIRWLGTAEPARLVRTTKWTVIALLAGAAVAALVSGRAAFAIPLLIGALTTWLTRLKSASEGGGDNHGAGHRKNARAPLGAMSRDEALDILGLEPGASEDDIRAAHRRLIRKLHPDQGGSDYLAAKLNEAKDVLLDKR